MTNALQNNVPDGVMEIDTTARCPLFLLVGSGLVWLVLGGVLALLNLAQIYTPALLADCAWLTYGRLQAMQETVLVYGWFGNAGLAVVLWVLARLGESPLRGRNYITVGALFWNLAITLSVIGIAAGDATSFPLLQMPRYVQAILLFSFAAIAVPGVLAWSGRRSDATFVSHWYALAALFLFPWFFSVAQMMLNFVPVRGTLQSVVATWYAQNVFSLWLAPVAMAAVYYLLPKITGRVIQNYDFAVYGFWTLLFFGCWMGGRHLIGGPVPAWIPTMAIVCAWLVLFHHIIVYFNLREVFRPGSSTVLKFLALGLGSYLLSAVVDTAFASRILAEVTQFTFFQQAQLQLAFGSVTLIIFGALYYLLPRLAGANWPSVSLIRGHFLAAVLGFILLVVALGAAGWTQGMGLSDAGLTFAEIAVKTKSWLLVATAAQGVLLVGNLLFLVHFLWLAVGQAPVWNLIRQPFATEATVS